MRLSLLPWFRPAIFAIRPLFALLSLVLLAASPTALRAQGVSFAGLQTTVPTTGLNFPYGVAVDSSGDVFIADTDNLRVVEVTPGGAQTIVLPADTLLDNQLVIPYGVAVDSSGDVFTADTYHNRVVEVKPGGAQTTVPATGLNDPNGVAVDSSGDVFIADTFNNRVVKVTPGGAQTTVPTTGLNPAGLNFPYGLAVDSSGDVFIADTYNLRVVEVTPGGAQTIVLPAGTYLDNQLVIPFGVAVDSSGDVFIADTFNNRVVKVTPGGAPTTVPIVGLNYPDGVAVDSSGDVFIADTENNRVVKLSPQSVDFGDVNVCPAGQTGPAPCSQTVTLNYNLAANTEIDAVNLLTLGGVNFDFQPGSVDLCESFFASKSSCTVDVTFAPLAPGQRNGAVQILGLGGDILATTYIHGTGVAPQAGYSPAVESEPITAKYAAALATDSAGSVYVADQGTAILKRYSSSGSVLSLAPLDPLGTAPLDLSSVSGIAQDGAGNVYFGVSDLNEVYELPAPVSANETAVPVASVPFPDNSLVADGAGNLYLPTNQNGTIVKIAAGSFAVSTIAQIPNAQNPERVIGLTIDAVGNLYAAGFDSGNIYKIAAGSYAVSTPTNVGGNPDGLAIDAAGDLYVSSYGGGGVVKLAAGTWAPTTIEGGYTALGIALDQGGNLYVGDPSAGVVKEYALSTPAGLNFNPTPVGSTSSDSPQSIQFQNIGNAALTGTGLLSDTTDFIVVTGSGIVPDCTLSTVSLNPGAECNLSLNFTPQSGGPLSSTLSFVDNALNAQGATQAIQLSGKGTQGSQTITFAGLPTTATYGSAGPYTLTATASSGLPVSYSVAGPATLSGTTLTITGAGTVTVTASQSGNANYAAATPVTLTITVSHASQTITFTGLPTRATYGSAGPYTLTATASSGLPVSYSVAGPATLSGTTLTITGAGTVLVTASQAGNAYYAAATPVTLTTAVATASFGSVNVCPAGQTGPAPCSQTLTLNYNIPAGITIGSVGILTTGAANLDFQAEANDASATLCSPQTYTSSTLCTVDVTFAPLAPGQRKGAVQILDGSGGIVATTYMYGTGVGPAVAFSPSPQLSVATGRGLFVEPIGVAVDASGNVFFAAYGEVAELPAATGYTTIKRLASTAISSHYPVAVAVDGAGNIFFADDSPNGVYEILAAGGYTTVTSVGSGFETPFGVAVDGSGNVFVAENDTGKVKEALAAGGYTTVNSLGSGFNQPTGVAVDGSGNVFVADTGNHAVKEILAAGGYTTVNSLGSGFDQPSGVAVDASGDVFVGNMGGTTIKEILAVNGSIPANPTIILLGGGFSSPFAVAVDGSGNVFIADLDNDAVKELQRSQPPALSFANTNVGSTSSDSPQSIQFQNIGNAALTGTGLLSDTTDFIVVTGSGIVPDCTLSTVSLNPGAECNLSLNFTPQSGGPLSSTLSFVDNALNAQGATQAIQLSGKGTQGSQTITFAGLPTTAAYGSAGPYTLTATASSGLPVSYSVAGPATLSGTTLTITGAGTVTVTASQSGNANYAAATPVTLTITVSHASQTITFTGLPTTATYGSAGPYTLTATASSGLPVSYSVAGPATLSGTTLTITGAGTVTVTASQSGNANYAAATPVTLTIAVSLPPLAQVSPGTLNFGTVAYGSAPTSLPLSVTNIGGGTLTIAPSISGPSYTITANTCAGGVAATNSCTLTIQFAPEAAATHNDVLTLTTNGATNPTVSLRGTANGLSADPTSTVNFGNVPYGSNSTFNLVIRDQGIPGPITLASLSINGPSYTILAAGNTCVAGLTKNSSCILPIEFNPVAVGTHDDTLTVTASNGSTFTVKLDGTGTGVGPTATLLSFGTIAEGSSSMLSLTIANKGISGTPTIATSFTNSDYSLASTTCASGVATNATCTLEIQFAPTRTSTDNGAVTVTASNGTVTIVALYGKGTTP